MTEDMLFTTQSRAMSTKFIWAAEWVDIDSLNQNGK